MNVFLFIILFDNLANVVCVNRMWVVLGCEFDKEEQKCMSAQTSFNGYLSQVNWYRKTLTFTGDSEISANFASPRLIFETSNALVLVWNEYELESGVNRMIPSEASGVPCDNVARVPACSRFACKYVILQTVTCS